MTIMSGGRLACILEHAEAAASVLFPSSASPKCHPDTTSSLDTSLLAAVSNGPETGRDLMDAEHCSGLG